MNQDIIQLKKDVAELKAWKDSKNNQQISYPLDIGSKDILSKDLLSFEGTIDTLGASGNSFPFAMVVNVNNINYYLSVAGSLLIYNADLSTDLIYIASNPFVNGDALVLYTDNQAPVPLSAGTGIPYFVTSVSGNTFKLSLTLNIVFTVSGITTAPTAGAVYTDGRSTYTVASTSLSGVSPNIHGTVTCTATGNPYQTPITIIKNSGTGDSSIIASWTANGGSTIDITTNGVGNQYLAQA